MAHWSEAYVGKQYVEGEYDCAAMVQEVQREVFKREVWMPTDRWYSKTDGKLTKFKAMAEQIAAQKHKTVVRTDTPQDGDAILIRTMGYLQHIGVYCQIGGEAWVLHAANMKVGQVVLQRLRELPMKGFHVEGFYKWI